MTPKQQASHCRRRRPRLDPPGTIHTFGSHRGRHRILGIIYLAISAAIFAGLVLGLQQGNWEVSTLLSYQQMSLPSRVRSCSPAWGSCSYGEGICSFRRGVQVSGGKLIIHNELRTRRVDAGDIRGITLEPKAVSQTATHWVARVELTDGESIWIDDLDCGTTRRPPRPELAATVNEIWTLLG